MIGMNRRQSEVLWLCLFCVALVAIGCSKRKSYSPPPGVLEFRIAPYIEGAPNASDYVISKTDVEKYVKMLQEEGAEPGRKRSDAFQWFPIRGNTDDPGAVTADYAGKTYLLLSNRPNDVVINSPGQAPWGISDAFASTDETGRPAVDITFDDTAAKLLTKLTGAHRRNGTRPGDHLAIVVKGEVYSLPTIQTTVSDMCQISGKFTQNDVSEMVNLLTKGS